MCRMRDFGVLCPYGVTLSMPSPHGLGISKEEKAERDIVESEMVDRTKKTPWRHNRTSHRVSHRDYDIIRRTA